MQHDELIWRQLSTTFCSFKVTTRKAKFCRNKYNISGLCERGVCPLSNSRYATIMQGEECLMLYIKTVERAHSPRNLWEKIKLSTDYVKALKQIDEHMMYWPEYMKHKAKQRLTKMVQMNLRKRRLDVRMRTRLVSVKKKVEKREKVREAKAEKAAKLRNTVEKELLERLRSGVYGDIYNYAQEEYENILDEEEVSDDAELEDEYVADYESASEDDEEEYEYEQEHEHEVDDIEQGDEKYDFDDEVDDKVIRSTAEQEEYVKVRAKKRKAPGTKKKAVGRKGKKLRRTELEMEYERETIGSVEERAK